MTDAFQLAKQLDQRQRIAERQKMSLHRRLQEATNSILLFASIKAANMESSSKSAEPAGYGPGRVDLTANEKDIARLLRVIEHAVVALEKEVDGYLGRIKHSASELAEEKDKRILSDYQGLSPHAVSEIAPELGTPRVIERVRETAGRNPRTGYRAGDD